MVKERLNFQYLLRGDRHGLHDVCSPRYGALAHKLKKKLFREVRSLKRYLEGGSLRSLRPSQTSPVSVPEEATDPELPIFDFLNIYLCVCMRVCAYLKEEIYLA